MLKRCWDICHFHLGIFIQVNQDSQQGSCFLDYVLCREPFVQVGLVNHAMPMKNRQCCYIYGQNHFQVLVLECFDIR